MTTASTLHVQETCCRVELNKPFDLFVSLSLSVVVLLSVMLQDKTSDNRPHCLRLVSCRKENRTEGPEDADDDGGDGRSSDQLAEVKVG
mmetsp:Transcript_28839/g.93021  ORF Transcript_28839/g.93021 Transcript_28839/m.93021 type:complete len:89 (-) Transcript_28839:785-1051(-)